MTPETLLRAILWSMFAVLLLSGAFATWVFVSLRRGYSAEHQDDSQEDYWRSIVDERNRS